MRRRDGKSSGKKDKSQKFAKSEQDRGFASYEDFADLLEEGVADAAAKSKGKEFLKKRTLNDFTRA